jgi:L-aminopeptidase/D-esterase-like protein
LNKFETEVFVTLNLAGLKIGHAAVEGHLTGSTVILCPEGTTAGVDVRGPAPGSRETALLDIDKPVHFINAIMFSGGSAFGLAAADGAMRFLGERNIGHPTLIKPIPIVPAAIIYDLFLSQGKAFPTAEIGYAACLNASDIDIAQGNAGAGRGATVGKWSPSGEIMKGGFGIASHSDGDLVVGAAAVVNAIGDILDSNGRVIAGARNPEGGWMVDEDPYRRFPDAPPVQIGTNTTLVVVYTNAALNKVEVNRLAQRAHDGLAIAIRPVHTTHDGDITFGLATGQVDGGFDTIASFAVHMVAEAIRNGVRHARSVGPILGLADGTI